ncbi:MAG: class I SAM-dependent methyltransferase [Proteobacteria bacterium]|nr:class I SAM-dependent methyltransferase [Pseudomonadota bacterium]
MSEGNPLGFHRRWILLKPPLRPDSQIIAAYRREVEGHNARVLLLGVTAELADIGDTTVAVDISKKMIASAWPGDTEKRKALHGNWLDMPLEAREFTAAIGDGILAGIEFPQYQTFFSQLAKLLLPGARIALRLYETPEPGETVTMVRDQTMRGKIAGFHAFKWRLAMAIAAETKQAAVPVSAIHRRFQREFPDRAALSAATGWSLDVISEIDAYDSKPMIYRFPTRRELLAHLPDSFANPRFAASGDYELAERCPLFVADIPS